MNKQDLERFFFTELEDKEYYKSRYDKLVGVPMKIENPGDWYRWQCEQADKLVKEIEQARKNGASKAEIDTLLWKLDLARYVGD